jgi:hypothetical protein
MPRVVFTASGLFLWGFDAQINWPDQPARSVPDHLFFSSGRNSASFLIKLFQIFTIRLEPS